RPASGGGCHPEAGAAGAGGLRLADQYRLRRAPQPQPAPACGGDWASRLHALQGRGGLAAAGGCVPRVLQFLLASLQLTPGPAAAAADQRDGLSQTLAASNASDGRGTDRSGVDPPGGVALSGAAVAAASGSVSKGGVGHSQGRCPEQGTCVWTTGLGG